MRFLIVGGGGFIGSNVADHLLRDGHTLRILERPHVRPYREFESHEPVEWLSGDLRNVEKANEAVRGADVVLHIASTTHPRTSNDDPVYDVESNLISTIRLVEAMLRQYVARIVFLSSGGTVYGTPRYLPVDEDHPTEPQVSHGIVKLAIEKYLLMYKRLQGLQPVILRVSNPYGMRQRTDSGQGVIAAFMHRVLNGLPIEIWGDGSVVRDYLYIGDLVEAVARAASYSGDKSVFNLGSGVGTSLNEAIDLIEEVLGMDVTRRYVSGREFDVKVNVLSTARAVQEFGWKPRVTLREGLIRTVRWMRDARSPQEKHLVAGMPARPDQINAA